MSLNLTAANPDSAQLWVCRFMIGILCDLAPLLCLQILCFCNTLSAIMNMPPTNKTQLHHALKTFVLMSQSKFAQVLHKTQNSSMPNSSIPCRQTGTRWAAFVRLCSLEGS